MDNKKIDPSDESLENDPAYANFWKHQWDGKGPILSAVGILLLILSWIMTYFEGYFAHSF